MVSFVVESGEFVHCVGVDYVGSWETLINIFLLFPSAKRSKRDDR